MAAWTSRAAASMFAVQIELQGNAGSTQGAGGGHLGDGRDAAELALQRGGDGGGHGFRTGPGKPACTEMVGKSTCGSGDTGSNRNATAPASEMAITSSVVAIGLRMKGSEIFMAYSAGAGSASCVCPRAPGEKRTARRSNQR